MSLSARIARQLPALGSAALFILAGCGTSATPTTTANPALDISLTQAASTVKSGFGTEISGSVVRPPGYTGVITITASGGAPYVSTEVTRQPTVGSDEFTIAVVANVVSGTYHLTVTASGAGATSVSAAYDLSVVQADAASGTFAATIDNETWHATSFEMTGLASRDSPMYISASDANYTVEIAVLQPRTGMFQMDGKSFSTNVPIASISDNVASWSAVGTLTITTLDSNHVAGSFMFTGEPTLPKSSGNRTVTGGTFDLKY